MNGACSLFKYKRKNRIQTVINEIERMKEASMENDLSSYQIPVQLKDEYLSCND